MAGYMAQKNIKPITAKEHMLKNWKTYNLVDTKKEFIELINILQAVGENIDTLHDCYLNGDNEFCDIYHNGCWDSDREIVEALFEFCTFYTDKEFIEMILDRYEDCETSEEWAEDIRRESSDDPKDNNDCQITKTEDGYVRRIWC